MKTKLFILFMSIICVSLYSQEPVNKSADETITSPDSFGYFKTGAALEYNLFDKDDYQIPLSSVFFGAGNRTRNQIVGLDSSISVKVLPPLPVIGVNLSEMLILYPSSRDNHLFLGAGVEGEIYSYCFLDWGFSPLIGSVKAAIGWEYQTKSNKPRFIQFEVVKPLVMIEVVDSYFTPDPSWTRFQLTFGF